MAKIQTNLDVNIEYQKIAVSLTAIFFVVKKAPFISLFETNGARMQKS